MLVLVPMLVSVSMVVPSWLCMRCVGGVQHEGGGLAPERKAYVDVEKEKNPKNEKKRDNGAKQGALVADNSQFI